MSTPVLTKKQLKHSLSAKKTPVKGLRNVLAQPHDNYWPVIDTDKCSVLEGILRKFAPTMKRPTYTVPWSQLRHMKKEERIQAKKEALLKLENVPDKDILNSIVVGLNAITRSLEKDRVCCVLLDANVEPPFLIKHIIIMAQNKKLPVLLLPSLKTITLNTIGFPTAAFALKNIVAESADHRLSMLYQNILNVFKDIPPPKKALQLFKDNTVSNNSTLDQDTETRTENQTNANTTDSEKFTLSTNVYKYRTSRQERAFIPPSAAQSTSVEKMECDFISLTKYDSESDTDATAIPKNSRYINIHDKEDSGRKVKKSVPFKSANINGNNTSKTKGKNYSELKNSNSTNVKYLSLKVKRLQGNSNRVKATKLSKPKKK